MKLIQNTSLQTFPIYLRTEKGCKEVYLRPRQNIVVPDSYITEQITLLVKRRLFKVTNAW